jgi:predicted secreted protein
LEGNATTGDQWRLEFDESKLKLIGDDYRPAAFAATTALQPKQ